MTRLKIVNLVVQTFKQASANRYVSDERVHLVCEKLSAFIICYQNMFPSSLF